MAGLITQLEAVEQGREILANATRATQQFVQAANVLSLQLAAFETNVLPGAGLDADTLAEVATRKAAKIAEIDAALVAIRGTLAGL